MSDLTSLGDFLQRRREALQPRSADDARRVWALSVETIGSRFAV